MKTKSAIYWVFLLGFLPLFMFSCSKKNEPASPSPTDIVIAKEVKVISNEIWNDYIISLDSTTFTVIFKNGITSKFQFKTGDIIVTAVGEGFLRKVTSISTVNNTLRIETGSASVTDCIKQGVIDINQPLTLKQIKRIEYRYKGIKLKSDNLKSSDNAPIDLNINTIIYDNDNDLNTTNDQIKLVGELICNWGFNLHVDIGLLSGLNELKFGVNGSENLDLQLISGLQYNMKKEYSLATVYFTPIPFSVGIIPFVLTPQLDIIVGIDGSANATITTGISQSLSFDNGINYEKGQGWAPYKTFDKNFSFQPPQINVNASATAYLKPEFSTLIDFMAGPYANLKIYSRLDADILQTPWWKLYGGLNMEAGAKIDIIDILTVDYIVSDLINVEILLAQATNPPVTLPTVSTAAITNISYSTASSGGNVTSEGNGTVTAKGVCWSNSPTPTISDAKTIDGTGLGIFSSSITNLAPGVNYYVCAYATNIAGTAYGDALSLNGLSVDINNLVPQSILNEMQNLGMPVYSGYSPPTINGIYNVSPLVLYSSNIINDNSPGYQFTDLHVQFYNQDNSKLTINADYIEGDEVGTGLGSFIAGCGNNFTVFVRDNSIYQGYPAVTVDVYSGTIGPNGISNLYYSVFMVENYGMDSIFISNGSGRVTYDQDGFSEIITTLKTQKINTLNKVSIRSPRLR